MNSLPKADILGCYVDIVTMSESINLIKQFIDTGKPKHIITLNAEIAYQAQYDQNLRSLINNVNLVTPDGIGIVWGGKILGYPIKERVTGIDLLYNICNEAVINNWPIYLLGASPGVAEAASYNLKKRYEGINICGTRDGYFSDNEIPMILDEIKTKKPAIVFVALGAPRQELFINKYKDESNIPVWVGVGGSFDVISGNKKRAPKLMIKLNLEWLYRLMTEPSRIKRQLNLPKFALSIMKQKYSR